MNVRVGAREFRRGVPWPVIVAAMAVLVTLCLLPVRGAHAAGVRIHDITGIRHTPAMVGQHVDGVPGVVTSVQSTGFTMQDPQPDNDVRTSEGIFVFSSTVAKTVHAGEALTVSGTVSRFRPGGTSSDNLSITELTSPSVVQTGEGQITPTRIGDGGRRPPNHTIEGDVQGDVDASNAVLQPERDGLDFDQSLEGMLVEIDRAVAVAPTNSFGELWVLPDDGGGASPRDQRGGIVLRQDDPNPERMQVDDALLPGTPHAMPSVSVGAHLGTPLRGVMDYDFGNFRIHLLTAPTVADNGLQPEVTAPQRADQLSVATFNLENLSPKDPASKFQRLASLIVENLRAPDLISVEEIQDNDGPTDDGVVDASTTFASLEDAIVAQGGPRYDHRDIAPTNDADGGQPGGNIRTGFLFRTDRGLSFVDRPGGTATAADSVVGSGASAHLAFSPGRVDPANAAWKDSRKPLAAEFTYRGKRLFVIGNHLVAKLADQDLFGRQQPPQEPSEATRIPQTTAINGFVSQIEQAQPNADVIVLGDMNDMEFSDSIHALEGRQLRDLADTLPPAEHYSYVYEGNSELLDHTLVSPHLFSTGHPDYDIVHVNAEFADQASDHDPQVTRLTP